MNKATIALLAAAMLPALSQAQTVNICDRTPQVLEQILWETGASDCAAVDPAMMANMQELRLTEAEGLTALAAGDFAGLTSLEGLYLMNGDQLRALPPGAFNGLTSLEILDLSGNQFRALPPGVFNGLTSRPAATHTGMGTALAGQTQKATPCGFAGSTAEPTPIAKFGHGLVRWRIKPSRHDAPPVPSCGRLTG